MVLPATGLSCRPPVSDAFASAMGALLGEVGVNLCVSCRSNEFVDANYRSLTVAVVRVARAGRQGRTLRPGRCGFDRRRRYGCRRPAAAAARVGGRARGLVDLDPAQLEVFLEDLE